MAANEADDQEILARLTDGNRKTRSFLTESSRFRATIIVDIVRYRSMATSGQLLTAD